jgi:hypothetical protein
MNWTLEHKGIKVDMTYAISKQIHGEWTREQVEAEIVRQKEIIDKQNKVSRPRGYHSNSILTRRNGGVRHQFQNSIGGCASNYR